MLAGDAVLIAPVSGKIPCKQEILQGYRRFWGAEDGTGSSSSIVLGAPIWISTFRINERQISSYRAGHIFLAGDAAHVHSPAGCQGMNAGMQDAINLAWKLAMVRRGLAADALLDSYDTERRPVGAEVIATAGRMTKIATIHNPLARHIRNIVAHFMLGLLPVQRALEASMTEVSIGYPDSPLSETGSGSPQAGKRMRPLDGEAPYGAGDVPRFTVRAPGSAGKAGASIAN